jgi:hypothetical protein
VGASPASLPATRVLEGEILPPHKYTIRTQLSKASWRRL